MISKKLNQITHNQYSIRMIISSRWMINKCNQSFSFWDCISLNASEIKHTFNIFLILWLAYLFFLPIFCHFSFIPVNYCG